MLRVLLFTCSVLVGVLSHSIALGIGMIVTLVIYVLATGSSLRFLVVYLLSIVSGWGSVLVYDTIALQALVMPVDSSVFTVLDQQRENRYLIGRDNGQEFLLYSLAHLSPGDSIQSSRSLVMRTYTPQRCRAVCKPSSTRQRQEDTFDYDAWLYMQRLDGSLYDDNPYIDGSVPLEFRIRVRQSLKNTMTQTLGSGTVGALGLGMLIGDRSLFAPSEYKNFISSGLVHLVAVSGGNIAIMVALASLLLFWVPFSIRIVLLIIVVIGYAYLVGSDSSVIRATIMALLTLAALLPGRQISIWRLLAYAWTLMLLWNPYYLVYDLGFLLSFGALLGIIWSERYIFQRLLRLFSPHQDKNFTTFHLKPKPFTNPWRKEQSLMVIRLIILPSVGAMVGVLPVLMWSTGQINLLSPIFNILIVPFVPLLTFALVGTAVFSSSVFSGPLSRGLGAIIQASERGVAYGPTLLMGKLGAGIFGAVLVSYWSRWIYQENKIKEG